MYHEGERISRRKLPLRTVENSVEGFPECTEPLNVTTDGEQIYRQNNVNPGSIRYLVIILFTCINLYFNLFTDNDVGLKTETNKDKKKSSTGKKIQHNL